MELSAPTIIVFVISVVIAAIGLAAGLGLLAALPVSAFWIMAVAYAVLAVGCLFKGL